MQSVSPVTSADVLHLVQVALERFDLDSLSATLRRTARIASLLGETRTAIRIGLELKPSGGHPPANAEMSRRLMANPDEWGDPDSVAEAALEDFLNARKLADDKFAGHSIDELMFWERKTLPDEELSDSQRISNLEASLKWVEHIGRARHEAFTCLCEWERRLTFAATQERALHAVSMRVDSLLSGQAPNVLEQFNVAFRRLRETDTATNSTASSEALSQVPRLMQANTKIRS